MKLKVIGTTFVTSLFLLFGVASYFALSIPEYGFVVWGLMLAVVWLALYPIVKVGKA
jgi:hypothetical protein